MTQVPDWVQYLSAFLTPIIALTTSYLAIQQHRIERAKYKFDLYEKRSRIFSETQAFIKDAVLSAKNTKDRLHLFQDKTIDRYFLFGKDVNDHIDSIELDTENLAHLDIRSQKERSNQNIAKADELGKQFVDLSVKLTRYYNEGNVKTFGPYLQLNQK